MPEAPVAPEWPLVGEARVEGARAGGDPGRYITTGCIACGRCELPPHLPAGIDEFPCGHRAFRAVLEERHRYGGAPPPGCSHLEAPGDACPLCPFLEGEGAPYVSAELHPYYRLPPWGGTIIVVAATVDRVVLATPTLFTADSPRLLDFSGYRGTGLHVIHSGGISPAIAEEYFPVWDLYEDYITPPLLADWASRMGRQWGREWRDICEGFRPRPGVLVGVDLRVVDGGGADAELLAALDEGELTIDYGGAKVLRIKDGEAHFGAHLLAARAWEGE